MLFNSLSKLKRTMVMMIICLLFTGLTMFAVPVSYIPIRAERVVAADHSEQPASSVRNDSVYESVGR